MPDQADGPLPDHDPLRLFFKHSPDACLLIEPAGSGVPSTILDCNDVACALYGYDRGELIGRPLDLLHLSHETPEPLGRAGRQRLELVHRCKDGSRVEVELSLTSLKQDRRDLILAIARDMSAHRRTERRLTAQHAIGRVLADAGHFMDAAPRILQIMGESLEWDRGAMWCVDADAGVLRHTIAWRPPGTAADDFDESSRRLGLAPDIGLPGRVWASGQPLWIGETQSVHELPRYAEAMGAGLHSAFAFPIKGPSVGIFGVMEFFSREPRPPDAALLEMVAAIGSHCGEYIERRRAEQAVRAGEALKAAVFHAALDGIITIDHQGRVVEFNPAAEAIFGYRREDVLGQEMAELIVPPALREHHRRGLANYLATGEGRIVGRRIELTAIRADGSEVPVELTITPIPGEGTPVFTGFVRDITERRRAEQRLAFLAEASTLLSASLDYEATLASLPRLVVPRIADWCSLNLLDANRRFLRVAATHVDPAKEVMLRDLRDRHPPDLSRPTLASEPLPADRPLLIPEVTDEVLARVAQNAEQLQIYRLMGFLSAIFVPLRMGERLLGTMILASGESGRRYGPDDLALAEDLAHRAALAIENARLYEEAQAAVRLRDEFLSIAAHELKTPVTAVLGYSQVLQRRASQAQAANGRDGRAVQVIIDQAERLSRLVTSLLDVSRLETGQFTLDCRPVDLVQLARRVVDETRLTVDSVRARHTIECVGPEQSVVVAGDAMRLEQVLQNLLQNAIKYSPDGGSIAVRVEQRRNCASVSIADQGIGVPKAAQAQLFQRFYRAGNLEGLNISGMGIGLYVVKEIVTRHGGTVEVESGEGAGSTFTVTLPLAVA